MSPRKERIGTSFDGFRESDLEEIPALLTEDVVRDTSFSFDVDLSSHVESYLVLIRT
jgi:hypothetical protein